MVLKEMHSTSSITELHYLPSILWFAQIISSETLVLEANENFQKQTFRNRTTILSANGPLNLTVPVVKGRSSYKIKMEDIQIDYGQPWNVTHWRTLVSSYSNSSYFEYYAPELEFIYASKPASLFQLNEQLLSFCLKCLSWKKEVIKTQTYNFPDFMYTNDFRSRIDSNDLERWRKVFKNHPYPQVFGKEFVINLSIIDLLANLGPDASAYLKRIVSRV
jgi:hypothetical protein